MRGERSTSWAQHLVLAWWATGMFSGCGGSQAAATAKDPMRCERDPSCARARGSFPDCTKQCNDDQECESRCEQVQQGVDGIGHP